MKIAIDASNIRRGGGLTHLKNVLKHLDINKVEITQVILFAGTETLSAIDAQPWLVKISHRFLDKHLLWRVAWRNYILPDMLDHYQCEALFAPGGIVNTTHLPAITMSQNMLPFDKVEQRRYSLGRRLRYLLLGVMQTHSFNRVNGIIFLTHAHLKKVEQAIGHLKTKTTVIAHGVESCFFLETTNNTTRQRMDKQRSAFTEFKWVYVSYIKPYKHQWNVVCAINLLRQKGVNVTLDLIGPAYTPSLKRLKETMQTIDPDGEFITYHGSKYGEELCAYLRQADGFVFASTCETFGQVLLEAMASGLPIASSHIGVAQEIAQDCAEYFDPENIADIAAALNRIMTHPERRWQSGQRARDIAREYTVGFSANATFKFIAAVVKESRA